MIDTYNLINFKEKCKQIFLIEPCALCGQIHLLRFHGYPLRNFRGSEYSKTEKIQIIVILCKTSQKNGKPYTLRLLPDFLMPRCVIRLDKAVEAYQSANDPRDIEKACSIMCCIDDRTAYKHMNRIHDAIPNATLRLADNISQNPEQGELPETTPDMPPFTVLTRLYCSTIQAGLRSGDKRLVPEINSLIRKSLIENYSNLHRVMRDNGNPP